MIVELYGIYDCVARGFPGGLQVHRAEAAALRTYGDIAGDPSSMLARHPGDFRLMLIGVMDDETGVITPCVPRVVNVSVEVIDNG